METSEVAPVEARRRWMGVLAKAAPSELETACCALGALPAYTWLRPPETGLVMVRGRIGGTGAKFNVGEMTVTRCALRTDGGATGLAYVRGRDARHAELAALVDAMMQEDSAQATALESMVIVRLESLQDARRKLAARKAAATRVEFYTVARSAAA